VVVFGFVAIWRTLAYWVPGFSGSLFNIAPLTAFALFAGFSLTNRKLAAVLPVALVFLSDLLLLAFHDYALFYPGIAGVYVAYILIALLPGRWLANRGLGLGRGAVAILGSSLLFFVISNLGVWATGTLYPTTGAGLLLTFEMALPFLERSLIGDAVFGAVFLSAYAWAYASKLKAQRV